MWLKNSVFECGRLRKVRPCLFLLAPAETPSTMSPPHSMFISEAVDGQAKPEPMIEDSMSQPPSNAKVSQCF